MSKSPNLINVTTEMTDAELELACEARFTGIAPWAHWTSEIYSFGKCLRFWTKYPGFLPLFVYSDHGAGLHSHLDLHELEVFRRSIYVVKDIKKGELLSTENIRRIRPGLGLHSRHYQALIGKKAQRDMKAGEAFKLEHSIDYQS